MLINMSKTFASGGSGSVFVGRSKGEREGGWVIVEDKLIVCRTAEPHTLQPRQISLIWHQ